MKIIKSKTYLEKMAMPMIYDNVRFIIVTEYSKIHVYITTNDDDDDTVINNMHHFAPRKPYPGYAVLLEEWKMNKYLVVMFLAAESGFGPVLYDKCIEIASNMNRQLINSINYDALLDNVKLDDDSIGRTGAEARSVWQKYKQREDVVKHDLPTGEFSLSKPKGGKFFYE